MFQDIYSKLNEKIEKELNSTAEKDLDEYTNDKFSKIKTYISEFESEETNKNERINDQNINHMTNLLSDNKNFIKLKEYIETLKLEKYSYEGIIKTLKEKLKMSEAKIEEMAASAGMEKSQVEDYYKNAPQVKQNMMYAIREEKTFEKLMADMKVS